MAQVPNYSIQFGQSGGYSPMDAFKTVMSIAQMKQEAELGPLRKEQMQLSTEAAKREAELAPLRKDILQQSYEQGGLAMESQKLGIEAAKREAALAPLRETILNLQKDQAQTSLDLSKFDLSLAPEKKLELQLMNQLRAKQIDEAQAKLDAAIKDQTRQAMYEDKLGKLSANPNASAKDYAELAAVMPPQLADSLRASYKMMSDEKRQNSLNYTGQVLAAASAGDNKLAVEMLKKRAEGLRNTGQDQEAQGVETWASMFEKTPQFGKDMVATMLSTMPEGSKVVETALKMSSQRRLAEMPEDVRKTINVSVEEANKLNTAANRASEIADQFEQVQKSQGWWERNVTGSGSAAALNEWFKSQRGEENGITQLRKEYVAFRNSQASALLKDLRPASDTDVAMIMKGFLPETANAGQVASFLRGMAKASKIQSEVESSKAEWVQSVGTLGKSSSDMTINGVTVPAGTNFSKFTGMLTQRMYIDSIAEDFKAGRMKEDKAKALIQQAQKRKF